MKELKCNNCGATLKRIGYGRYKCEYCGSEYQEDTYKGPECLIRVISPQATAISATTTIDEEIIRANPDYATNCVLDSLSHSIAEAIKESMRVDTYYDPCTMKHIYRGYIRIIPEDYRYV